MAAETFDTTSALAALYLWLIFGFMPTFINCDLQRLLQTSDAVRHAMMLLSFYFLFTLLEASSRANVGLVFAKTLLAYALFLMLTKSKAVFIVPVLLLLLAAQAVRKQRDRDGGDESKARQRGYRRALVAINAIIAALAVAGMLHYLRLQRLQHGRDFSWRTFVFSTNARPCAARLS